MSKCASFTPPKPKPKPEAAATSPSPKRTALALALFGLSRAELGAMGEDRFEELLAETFEREVAKRMARFDAAMGPAKRMSDAGSTDAGLGLLRTAAVALSQEGLQ